MENNIFDKITLPETMTEEKIAFLKEALEGSRGLEQKALLPYFTKLIKKTKEQNIHFSDEEVRFIILAIKAASSAEEQELIDKLLKSKSSKA